MAFLSADEIKGATDWTMEAVECPEWGGSVGVRTFSGTARDWYEQWAQQHSDESGNLKDAPNVRAMLVVLTACDEAGNLLFSEADIPSVGKKNADVLDRLFDAAMRLNKLRKKDLEQAAKN